MAKLDPVKGYEIKVPLWVADDPYGGSGWAIEWAALTWRNNQLVQEPAPVDTGTQDSWWRQSVNYNGTVSKVGYRFYTSKGKHYVERFDLERYANNKWHGFIVTSKWKSGKWTKVKANWNVKLSDKGAAKYKTIPLSMDE